MIRNTWNILNPNHRYSSLWRGIMSMKETFSSISRFRVSTSDMNCMWLIDEASGASWKLFIIFALPAASTIRLKACPNDYEKERGYGLHWHKPLCAKKKPLREPLIRIENLAWVTHTHLDLSPLCNSKTNFSQHILKEPQWTVVSVLEI